MRGNDFHGLKHFLDDYPGMSIAPGRTSDLNLKGKFDFKADVANGPEIEDSFRLEILIPGKYPRDLPEVKEVGGKIPRNGDYHVNPGGTLCLGSPIRLLRRIHANPSLNGFAKNCLVPYLYAVSHKLNNSGDFIFGELAHGDKGIVSDYLELFRLKDSSQVAEAIRLLGLKKRIANKKPCPCGCGKRLGVCPLHTRLNEFRKMAPRSWFKDQAVNVGAGN